MSRQNECMVQAIRKASDDGGLIAAPREKPGAVSACLGIHMDLSAPVKTCCKMMCVCV